MPAGRDQRRAASMSEALRGLIDMGAGALKGGVQGLVGLPGDVEELVRELRSSPSPRVLPTSKEVAGYLPSTGADTKTWEAVGEQLNPVESLKPLLLAGKGAAAAKAGLYAGALRKDLLHSHDTNATDLLRQGKLPAELYNLSLGVSKNQPMEFGGNTLLVPHQGAFDPKTSPTALHAFDAYTPRHQAGQGKRVDDATTKYDVKQMQSAKRYLDTVNPDDQQVQEMLHEYIGRTASAAQKRLVDRFISQHPKGGIMAEGSGPAPRVDDLPVYGRGGYRGFNVERDMPPATGRIASYGHRFPDFKTYESSPYGAGRLDTGPLAHEVYSKANEFLGKNFGHVRDMTGIKLAPGMDVSDDPKMLEALRELASMKVHPQHSSVARLTMRSKAQGLLDALRKTKSDYGELKAFGPTGLHNDNFAGIVADLGGFAYGSGQETLKRLEQAAKQRGIPFAAYSKMDEGGEEGFKIAKQMQELRQTPGATWTPPPISPLHGTELGRRHVEFIDNIKQFTAGKKSKVSELTDAELQEFIEQGLDLGLDPNSWPK